MSTEEKITLARDQPVGDKPEGISDADWALFQSRRRAERLQVDVDENKLSATARTQWISKEFERFKERD